MALAWTKNDDAMNHEWVLMFMFINDQRAIYQQPALHVSGMVWFPSPNIFPQTGW